MNKFSIIFILFALLAFEAIRAADIPEFLASASGEISVVLKVADNPDGQMSMMALQNSHLNRAEKHRQVFNFLKNRVVGSQKSILAEIKSNKQLVSDYRSYWITDAIYIKGDADFIRRIAARNDIEHVFQNLPLVLVEPVTSTEATAELSGAEPGLGIIGAREAWAMGLTGTGSIVCNFDTGVEGDHPALASSWRGANGGTVQESWFDPYSNTTYPVDSRGHGTHTMGTMVGVENGDTVGVAPDAEWIAAAVVDRGGSIDRTIADILSAFEWAADPDGNPSTIDDLPDVVNNSWGVPAGFYGACDMTFWDAIDNLEALGVVCIFAAGNEGPNPSTLRTPADRITTQFNAFSVGAIDGSTMEVARYSSRGPSGCDGVTVKPEIVAPGSSIRSCGNEGGYVLKSGTSMAAPHISGVVALLRQFNPEASVQEIKSALLEGAIDMGTTGEDNDYGYGLVNVRRSLYHMPPPDHPFINVISIAGTVIESDIIEPGDRFSLRFELENLGSTGPVQAFLTSSSEGIEISGDGSSFGMINYHDTLGVTAFSILIPENFSGDQELGFDLELVSGDWSQTHHFTINIAETRNMAIASIATNNVAMSFSNFGQFGLGDSSVNPVGGIGFRCPADGIDLMKEASLMISSNGRVSDGARNFVNQPDNDFTPYEENYPSVEHPGMYADYDGFAQYTDDAAEQPIGVLVTQRCFAWDLNTKFVTVEFTVENVSGATINDLQVGLFCDWNLAYSSGMDDIVNYDDVRSLGYIQDSPTGRCAGICAITDYPSSYRAIDNSDLDHGFSESQKSEYMADGLNHVRYLTPGDYSQLITVGPYAIAPGESEVVAFAFVAGESLAELQQQADLAFTMYPQLTNISTETNPLPSEIMLGQNYPNPFNANTTIEFGTDAPTRLAIFDITGRLVKSFDISTVGTNSVVWDGKNGRGEAVVSGVYFYRLANQSSTASRRMIYLK